MSAQERAARLAKDYDFVRNHSTSSWLKVAVNDMRRVRRTMLTSSANLRQTTGLASWGRGPRVGGPLPRLWAEQVTRAYHAARRRVILLGLDGTLIQQEQARTRRTGSLLHARHATDVYVWHVCHST